MLVFSFLSNSERLSLRRALVTDMSKLEKEATLRSVLLDTAKSGERLRFFGPGMMIVAEGRVAFVGEDILLMQWFSRETLSYAAIKQQNIEHHNKDCNHRY